MKRVLPERFNIDFLYGINLVVLSLLKTSQGHCWWNWCGYQIMCL